MSKINIGRSFDLTAIADDKILLHIGDEMKKAGYSEFRKDYKKLLGI